MKRIRLLAIFTILLPIAVLVGGSVSAATNGDYPGSAKKITNIKVVDHPDAINIFIQGDQLLTYTSVKQTAPMALALYFTRTALATSENVFTPPNPVIQSISATEYVNRDHATRIKIFLKKEGVYQVAREGNGLKVTFAKSGSGVSTVSRDTDRRPETWDASPSSSPTSHATRLQSVYAARFGDGLKVFVGADGMITNYRSFTIDSPARIAFDIFNIKSPYENEKIIPVNTRWVKQIRYYSYPDRVRVILETEKAFLNNFSAYPIENGLMIQMGEAVSAPVARRIEAPTETHPPVALESPSGTGTGLATRVQSVYATQLDNAMLVTVRGDGKMTQYKTATTENPDRIVVDILGVNSPYGGVQSFPVDTRWVKSVHHENLGDRVQVVIETRKPYLNAYTVSPDANGLVVQVGPANEAPIYAQPPVAGARKAPLETGTVQDYGKPAWVNQIEFLSEEAGKSTLVVGTTRPVKYDIRETGDRNLEVRLENTQIPQHRRRPLITDRFESAIDKILPTDRANERNTTLFEIEMRESVPYFVEQEGSVLKVHFEASSISPKPMIGMAQAGEAAPPIASAVVEPPPPSPPLSAGSSPAPPSTPGALSSTGGSPRGPLPEPGDELTLDETVDLTDDMPKYTGEKIALDFFETDIKNVFRILREVSGKNFAIDKDVTGKVTLTLGEPVPWDQVLDLVLKMNKLGKTVEGNIIRIATRETLAEEEKLRKEKAIAELALQDQQKQLEPLVTEYIPVNYSNAKQEIQPHIEKLLTKERGSVSVDERTNMVILTDTQDKIDRAKSLIRKLDRVTPQVMIEARVVEASTRFSREMGTQWQAGIGVQQVGEIDDVDETVVTDGVVGVDGVTEENREAINSRVGVGAQKGYNELGGTYGYNMAMNFPLAASQFGSLGFSFVRIAGTPLLLNAKLQAAESNSELKIISAPKVVTLDNKKAVIKQGISYPYQTVEDGEVNVEFKDVDLLLEVTPHVTPDNRISMNITITKNDIGEVIEGEQSFNTKEAQTELLVNDGDTVVIGGIIKERSSQNMSGIPGISKIPLLGWLFKTEGKGNEKEELLIFITPKIIQLEQRSVQF